MPTQPVEEVLPREINNPDVAQVLLRFASLIDETVNFGTHVFERCLNSTKVGEENGPVLLSFRHVLELSDSISLLTRAGCAVPGTVLLRSVFETNLTIEYILKSDTQRRAAAFWVNSFHERKGVYESPQGTSPRAKAVRELLESDRQRARPRIPLWSESQRMEAIEGIDERLRSPEYREVEEEFQRTRKDRTGGIKWYSLFGGPPNVERLAAGLGWGTEYQLLYRPWSGKVHGTELFRDTVVVEDDNALIVQIRCPTGLQLIVRLCISFTLVAMGRCIDHFLPEMKPELESWYLREIRDFYMELTERELLHVR